MLFFQSVLYPLLGRNSVSHVTLFFKNKSEGKKKLLISFEGIDVMNRLTCELFWLQHDRGQQLAIDDEGEELNRQGVPESSKDTLDLKVFVLQSKHV